MKMKKLLKNKIIIILAIVFAVINLPKVTKYTLKSIEKYKFMKEFKKSVNVIWFITRNKDFDGECYLLDYTKNKTLKKLLKIYDPTSASMYKTKQYSITDFYGKNILIEGTDDKEGLNMIYNINTQESWVIDSKLIKTPIWLSGNSKIVGTDYNEKNVVLYDFKTKEIKNIEKIVNIVGLNDANITGLYRAPNDNYFVYDVYSEKGGKEVIEKTIYTRNGEKFRIIEQEGKQIVWDIYNNIESKEYNVKDFENMEDNLLYRQSSITKDGKYQISREKKLISRYSKSFEIRLEIIAKKIETGQEMTIFKGPIVKYDNGVQLGVDEEMDSLGYLLVY